MDHDRIALTRSGFERVLKVLLFLSKKRIYNSIKGPKIVLSLLKKR
jgi:hypothetical protein